MKKDNIILIGMPGAGKSTLGVVLAKRLGYWFIDCDLLIQKNMGKLLPELIFEHGSEGFIRIENNTLCGLDCKHHIIATGGSAVYSKDAMRHLRSIGRIVYISLGIEALRSRLQPDLIDRGIAIVHGSTLEDLYEERCPLYEHYADITVHTDGLSTLQAVHTLTEAVRAATR